MINFLKKERVLLLLVASMFTFHWFSKDISDPYQRPIVGDAQAYYAYLPALFIYQDLDYEFMETEAKQYYADGHVKDFIKEVDGEKVNKTFPGVAVLYAPFFFMAHGTAYLIGANADGFSTIYQFWFDIGLWFYFLFGLIFLKKLLDKLDFEPKIALFSTILIGIGTNVFFYTVYDQSVTHIYNFFLINGMLLSLAIWEGKKKLKWLIIATALLVLIGITRPTNFLVFGLIFIFFGKKQFFLDVFKSILSKNWWKFTFTIIPILSVPFLLWKAQTGNWVVYSYGEEGFNFDDPYIFSFLFSYMKGWLIYTPVALPILIFGLILLFTKSKLQFGLTLGFYMLAIFIFASWWCWYYGAGMSQRVMIDHYVLLAFLLALTLKHVWDKKVMRITTLSLLGVFSALNIAQAYQIFNGIYQFGSPTEEQYWDNFLVFEKHARVYPPDHWEYFDDYLSWEQEVFVDEANPYSMGLVGSTEEVNEHHKLVLSFDCKSAQKIVETRAVLVFHQADSSEVSYPFYIKEWDEVGEWERMEFLLEPGRIFEGPITIFFWNGGTSEQAEFRNVKLEKYYSEEYY